MYTRVTLTATLTHTHTTSVEVNYTFCSSLLRLTRNKRASELITILHNIFQFVIFIFEFSKTQQPSELKNARELRVADECVNECASVCARTTETEVNDEKTW